MSLRTITDPLGDHRTWRLDEIDKIAEWLEVDPRDPLFPKRPN